MRSNTDDLLTIDDAARYLRRSSKTIERWIAAGGLRTRSRRSGLVIARGDIQALPVYTAGVLARLAGCSRKTVGRRVDAGALVPKDGPFAYDRFDVRDLRILRESLPAGRKRASRRSTKEAK